MRIRTQTAVLVVLASLTLSAQPPTPLERAKQLQVEIGQLVAALSPEEPAPADHLRLVPAGGDLQAAIDDAQPGDTIQLASGAVYTGAFKLPVKDGPAPVTITTATEIPAGRMTPSAAAPLAKIESGSTLPAISTADGAHNYVLLGLEVRSTAGKYPSGLIVIGRGEQTELAQVPSHVVVDRCWIHGDSLTGAKRGIEPNGADVRIVNNTIDDIKGVGQDTQAIGVRSGPGPFLIENNRLDAAGENIIFGGADPLIPNLVPADVIIRGNTVSKPLAWRPQDWAIKNVIELKNAQRVLIEHNIIENSWTDGQTGFLVVVSVRNQSGHCPWCTVADVEIRGNVARHGNQFLQVLGLDDIKDSSGVVHPSVRLRGLHVHDNLVYDVGGVAWGGGATFALALNNGPADVTIAHNTIIGPVSTMLGLNPGAAKGPSQNLQVRCNVLPEGRYGIAGDGTTSMGTASWTAGTDAASAFVENAIQPGGYRKIPYPGTGNRLAAMVFEKFMPTPALACSDGKPAGVDVDALLAAIPGLDLAQ